MPHWSVVYLYSEWIIRIIMLFYVPQHRSAAASRTWLLLIFLLPLPGLILYMMLGRIYLPRKRLRDQQRASLRIRDEQDELHPGLLVTPALPPTLGSVPALAESLGDFKVFGGNDIELLEDYSASLNRLLEDIESAQHHVHLQTYILGADPVGEKFASALIRARKRNVICRLMADAVGSRRGIVRFYRPLTAAGVEVVPLMQAGFLRRNAARFDLRNHRKLAVIDGRIGHVGSQNIVDPNFIRDHPNEELVARVTGPVVTQMQALVLSDYFFETGVVLSEEEYLSPLPPIGRSPAQMMPSGPGYQRENGKELMLELLYSSRENITLITPYFVPDEPFLQAMRSAARRGVDVHLIVSKHANQLLSQFAQRSYYEEILKAGVHIHLYRPHFLHAKHLSVDRDVALVGSTNIDIRSFALNAESTLLIYDRAVVARLRAIQDRCIRNSDQIYLEAWRKRRPSTKVLQNLARLCDSLL
ncbi:MAG TPA: cardiolipin synthase [Chthoniobacterales bacterium]